MSGASQAWASCAMCADVVYSTVDTSGYTCIADALLAPEEGTNQTAPEEPTDDPNALLPTGYKLCNVVPITSPPPSATAEPRTLASLMASPDTISPDASARRASTVSKAEGGGGSRRPSARGAGKAGLETPETAVGEASGSSGDTGSGIVSSRTGSIVSSALVGPESSPHTSSAPSKSSSSGSTPMDPAPTWKRNLMGNWAVGCRKMYGMGTPDDLGIWFVFTVSTAWRRREAIVLMSGAGRLNTAAGAVCAAVPVFQLARRADRVRYTASTAATATAYGWPGGTERIRVRAERKRRSVDECGYRAVSRVQAEGGRSDPAIARQHRDDIGRRYTIDACGKGSE